MAVQKKKNASRKIIWIVAAIAVVVFAALLFLPKFNGTDQATTEIGLGDIQFDFDNQIVTLNNESLPFVDGIYQSPDGQRTARITNRYANPSDTRAAAILIDSPAGSGSFYYLIGASSLGGSQVYTTPILLGDRIVIDSVTIDDSSVTVDYLGRPANAPMSDEPTENMSVTYLFQDDGSLTLVE